MDVELGVSVRADVNVGVGVDAGVSIDLYDINLYDIHPSHLNTSTPYSPSELNCLTHLLLLSY